MVIVNAIFVLNVYTKSIVPTIKIKSSCFISSIFYIRLLKGTCHPCWSNFHITCMSVEIQIFEPVDQNPYMAQEMFYLCVST